ncbi:phage portal protein [Rhizobium ruizarguesonis]|uniref:phage portal protein n=1 Tax=Rhizobium ruizarguesonis TaxID=2081791 RepID=UPI0010319D5A|nr:phage portal protein [Rhizobium ruizarguesonis]TAU48185.1 phage portal protein [Rhizobium ruizarguesonis]TAU63256.1 phage portal protein [Rhizobium ruizarguesonis]
MNFAGVVSSAKKALGFPVELKAYSLNSPEFSDLIGIRPTYSGVNIGGQSALYAPAVLQAVRLISETIGSLPCKVYRETVDGKEAAKDHSAYRIVHKRANEWTGAGDLRTRLTADALMHGNGYAKVVRFEDGRPFELHRLKPEKVTHLEDDLTGAPVYRVSEKSGIHDYPHTEILHIPSFLGKSPISFGKEAIGLASILERHGAQLFGSGARPTIVIKTKIGDNDAGANKWKNIRNDFRRWRSDPSEPLILPPETEIDQPVMTSTDAQFLEHRLEQVREIARIFGVPPTMLFELTRGTWSNTEQMGAQFLQLCLRPWLDRWQEAYATVLLSEDEQDSHYFEFVTDDLMRADAASRTANMTALVTNRIMTPNEVRAILNLQPLPGGDELINPHTTSNAAPVAVPAKESA